MLVCLLVLVTGIVPVSAVEYQIQMRYSTIDPVDFSALKRAGIRTVMARVFQDDEVGGGVYFANSRARVIAPLLDRILPSCRQNGVNVWGWTLVRKFNWLDDDRLYDMESAAGRRSLIRKLDLFNPDAVQWLLGVLRELAGKEIQGILLQDDFCLRVGEGFSAWGRAEFARQTGLPAVEEVMLGNGLGAENWKRIRVNRVNQVLREIIAACRSVHPGLQIGMNVYYETPLALEHGEAWYAHNLREILDTGIDRVFLMAYHRQMKSEMHVSETRNRELFRTMVENALAVCGDKLTVKLQVRDWDDKELVPVEEMNAYLALIPPQVSAVCFTSVEFRDLDYLRRVLADDTP